MKATVTPRDFSMIYHDARNTRTSEGDIMVFYYKENSIIHFYFKFQNVLFCTRINNENFGQFVINFQKRQELTERMSYY